MQVSSTHLSFSLDPQLPGICSSGNNDRVLETEAEPQNVFEDLFAELDIVTNQWDGEGHPHPLVRCSSKSHDKSYGFVMTTHEGSEEMGT